jgi:hypothetical protein
MQTSINYTERLEALVARREQRNPGLARVRTYKWGKKTALLWDYFILPTKQEVLDSLK